MEIKKKIIISLYTSFLFLNGCSQTKQNNFYIEQNSGIEKITSKIENLKENIYKYNGKIYLGSEYTRTVIDENGSLKKEVLGIYLHKKINKSDVNQVVDVKSYEILIKNKLYKDERRVYLFPKGKGCFLCLKILDINPNHLKILNNEYIIDDKNIYCINDGITLPVLDVKHFTTFTDSEGVIYGVSKEQVFSNCEIVQIESLSYETQKKIKMIQKK